MYSDYCFHSYRSTSKNWLSSRFPCHCLPSLFALYTPSTTSLRIQLTPTARSTTSHLLYPPLSAGMVTIFNYFFHNLKQSRFFGDRKKQGTQESALFLMKKSKELKVTKLVNPQLHPTKVHLAGIHCHPHRAKNSLRVHLQPDFPGKADLPDLGYTAANQDCILAGYC